MSIMLQDIEAFEGIMMVLKGQVGSIRGFNDALVDKLKQLIYRLQAQLNLLAILRADIESLIEQTSAELHAERML